MYPLIFFVDKKLSSSFSSAVYFTIKTLMLWIRKLKLFYQDRVDPHYFFLYKLSRHT